jgi:hypothetical protein
MLLLFLLLLQLLVQPFVMRNAQSLNLRKLKNKKRGEKELMKKKQPSFLTLVKRHVPCVRSA